jgi:hypothetical protein
MALSRLRITVEVEVGPTHLARLQNDLQHLDEPEAWQALGFYMQDAEYAIRPQAWDRVGKPAFEIVS